MSSVSPGYVFTSASDPILYSKLNLLGTPTVTIGTNEITTAMISDHAVTMSKLSQFEGGGFVGKTSNPSGNLGFVILNDGSVTWAQYSLSIGKASGLTSLVLGNSDLKKLSHLYDSSLPAPYTILVGSSTTTVSAYADGVTDWTGGAFSYYIGNGSSSRQVGLGIALSGGIPVVTSPGVFANGAASGLGYSSGAGGTVTQNTNRTTAVTVNKVCGAITTNNTSLAALASATFSVLNSTVAATDTIVAVIKSGAVNEKTMINVNNVNAGGFSICVYNADTGVAETGSIVINFAVIKAVVS